METPEKPLWKTLSFWVAIVMTNIGLILANDVTGAGTATQVMGWILTIATALGYKALPVPKQEEPVPPVELPPGPTSYKL